MNSDSYFRIGSTHQICEDYAISGGTGDMSFAIMSDGCSGSPRTDFGARFLSLAMEQMLSVDEFRTDEPGALSSHGLLMAEIMVKNIMDCSRGINMACLDATLGYVFADDTHFRAFLSGDGAVAALKKNGNKWASIIEYPSGAPPYLSYNLDEERARYYMEQTGGCPLTIDTCEWEPEMVILSKETIESEGMHSHFFVFPRDEYELVIVMSDGICSFQKPKNSETTKSFEEVDPIHIIDELLAVKSPTGDFIKRRCKRIIKNCLKSGWKHLDDFSVAAIHSHETCSE